MSSLNDIQLATLKKLLLQRANAVASKIDREILEAFPWSETLAKDVSISLTKNPPTQEGVEEIVQWSWFVLSYRHELCAGGDSNFLFEYQAAILSFFDYRAATYQIPFKYWADIAPNMFAEARRFIAQDKSWLDYEMDPSNALPINARDEKLKSDPETYEIYRLFNNGHEFRYAY